MARILNQGDYLAFLTEFSLKYSKQQGFIKKLPQHKIKQKSLDDLLESEIESDSDSQADNGVLHESKSEMRSCETNKATEHKYVPSTVHENILEEAISILAKSPNELSDPEITRINEINADLIKWAKVTRRNQQLLDIIVFNILPGVLTAGLFHLLYYFYHSIFYIFKRLISPHTAKFQRNWTDHITKFKDSKTLVEEICKLEELKSEAFGNAVDLTTVLPFDVLGEVYKHLSMQDLQRVAQVNPQSYRAVQNVLMNRIEQVTFEPALEPYKLESVLRSDLRLAIAQKYVAFTKAILATGLNQQLQDLHNALSTNNLELFKALVQKATDADKIDVLTHIMSHGLDYQQIRIILDELPSLFYRSNEIYNDLLIYAVKAGDIYFTDFLLKRGASFSEKQTFQISAFEFAICTNQLDCLRLFIEANQINVLKILQQPDFRKSGYVMEWHLKNIEQKLGVIISRESIYLQGSTLTMILSLKNLDVLNFLFEALHKKSLDTLFTKNYISELIMDCNWYEGVKCIVERMHFTADDFIEQLSQYDEKSLIDKAFKALSTNRSDTIKLMLENAGENAKHLLTAPIQGGFTALSIAAIHGATDVMRELLASGAEVDFTSKDGVRALKMAIRHGHFDCVTLLLENGADISVDLPLHNYASSVYQRDHYQSNIVTKLLEYKPNINEQDEYGYTALYIAVQSKNAELVPVLLNAGADPNIADNFHKTPLEQAALNGDKEIVRLLLEKGAQCKLIYFAGIKAIFNTIKQNDIATLQQVLDEAGDRVNEILSSCFWGYSPLSYAVSEGHMEIVELLLKRAGNILYEGNVVENAKLRANMLMDEVIEEICSSDSVEKGRFEFQFKMIVLARSVRNAHELMPSSELFIRNSGSYERLLRQAVSQAICHRRFEILAMLIKHYSSLLYSPRPMLVLAQLIPKKNEEDVIKKMFELLYKSDNEVEIIDEKGRTLLMLALGCDTINQSENIDETFLVAKLLLEAGVDPNRFDRDNKTALELAATKQDSKAVQLLLNHGAKLETLSLDALAFVLVESIKDKNLNLMNEVLKVASKGKHKLIKNASSAIIEAVKAENKEMILALLKHGFDINTAISDQYPLSVAIETKNTDIFKLLLKNGANLALIRPLHVVASLKCENHVEEKKVSIMVKEILKHKVGLDSLDPEKGKTAIFKAVESNSLVVVNALVKAGADPNIPSNDGSFPIDFCKSKQMEYFLRDYSCGTGKRL